jgi:hypothetical protein
MAMDSGLFPEREPDHAVFPRELVGVAGNDRVVHVLIEDPQVPIGSLKEAWETAKKAADVSCRWHDLRHTACTRLLEAGTSLAIVARILGWRHQRRCAWRNAMGTSATTRSVGRWRHLKQRPSGSIETAVEPASPTVH